MEAMTWNRREFAGALAGAALAAGPTPVLDTHIHLFDPTRPQGVPWPPKSNAKLYQPALPPRYRQVVEGLNVIGAIEVECSPWFEDNQWVLDVAATDPIIVGMIGNLEPASPEFGRHLDRLRRNPLYLGIRYGYLWERDLRARLAEPAFQDGLKRLSDAGLTLDAANPSLRLVEDILRVKDARPRLRVVVDHLPRMSELAKAERELRELATRPDVWIKVSGVVPHRPERLDLIYEIFGPDRLLYGSDWPNSDNYGSYGEGFAIVKAFFEKKGRDVAAKYFWRNSKAAYRWKERKA
jgi:predicted TIM-barrel fold metal-dependent hydrolase